MKHLYKILFFSVFLFIFGCENKEYVKDFKIEEIAVGDSLLTYFSKEDILSLQRTEDVMGNPIDLKDYFYIDAQFDNYQFETYDSIQVYYKLDDEKFIIHGIGGIIWFDTNLQDHYHFYDPEKDELIDINKNEISFSKSPKIPNGKIKESINIIINLKNKN